MGRGQTNGRLGWPLALPCIAAPPIQNLLAVSVGVLITNSPPSSLYTAVVSMPITFEPCPSSVIL